MFAYKGFHKDLTCTMGEGIFRYEPGKWYREDNAHCGKDGFHATDNPLSVLAYYSRSDDRFFIVNLRGNIDEDGTNSRISAPEIKLVRELTRDELYHEGVVWMAAHQKAPWAAVVEEETGDAHGSGNVIVRGRKPRAKGRIGDNLYIVKENKNGEILEIGALRVDGKDYLPDTYYDVRGGVADAEKRAV